MTRGDRLTVLAIVADPVTVELLPKAVSYDRLFVVDNLAEGLLRAKELPPDIAFIDVTLGEGAGLAMIHHVKAMSPGTTVIALSPPEGLESAANAVALGGSGLLVLPLEGDEVRSAISAVRERAAEASQREELERGATIQAKVARWVTAIVDAAARSDRSAATRRIARVFAEATGATGVAVYVSGEEQRGDGSLLMFMAADGDLVSKAPSAGTQREILAYASERGLIPLVLSSQTFNAGMILLRCSPEALQSRGAIEDSLFLLTAQATTTLALLAECERSSDGGAIKDPASSAYSFAYYVDVAGREIDRAKRYGRRFAIATVVTEPCERDEVPQQAEVARAAPVSPAAVADRLLESTRETAIVARVDEQEFQLLLPETDGLGAHACRRRVLSRLGRTETGMAVTVGAATFPHDGRDLSQLLRVARRRAERSRSSPANLRVVREAPLPELLEALLAHARAGAPAEARIRRVDMPISEAVTLVSGVVAEAQRGGQVFAVVTQHAEFGLGGAVRAAIPPESESTVSAVDLSGLGGCEDLEVLAMLAEHGAYALIARQSAGALTGVHTDDPLVVDLLTDRIGRAAGLRLFG